MTLQVEGLVDNSGRGWKRLCRDELVGILYIWLKVMPRYKRRYLNEKHSAKSDQSAHWMAEDLADRLRHHAVLEALPGPHVGIGRKGRVD